MEIRKLKDLSFDEGLDFTLALSPAIPMFMQSEFLRMKLLGVFNDEIAKQRKIIRSESVKDKGRKKIDVINDASIAINSEIAEMVTRDVAKTIPKLLKDYRESVFEALAVLCKCSVSDISKQTSVWGVQAIWRVWNDTNLKDFLPSAEGSEPTELLPVTPSNQENSGLTDS